MTSPKRLARTAGVLYLLVGIFGGFAQGFVEPKMYVAGDAAATAGNVVANAELVRVGVVADLLDATIFVFLALALYSLLKHVRTSVTRAMLILVAISATIECLNSVFEFAGLRVATDSAYAAAFGAAGSNALVLLLLDTQHYGLLIAQIFFGLWLAPLGYLAYRSGLFPKALGVVLIVGAACYIVDLLVAFLLPGLGQKIHGYVVIPSAIAEISMVGYLLVVGVKTVKPPTSAGATASAAGRRGQPLQASQQGPSILGRDLLQGGGQSDQVQNAVLPHSGDSRIGEDNRKLALVLRIAVAGKKAAALEAFNLLRR
jgi:hypothetical protein